MGASDREELRLLRNLPIALIEALGDLHNGDDKAFDLVEEIMAEWFEKFGKREGVVQELLPALQTAMVSEGLKNGTMMSYQGKLMQVTQDTPQLSRQVRRQLKRRNR